MASNLPQALPPDLQALYDRAGEMIRLGTELLTEGTCQREALRRVSAVTGIPLLSPVRLSAVPPLAG